jgi:hypothetical protein
MPRRLVLTLCLFALGLCLGCGDDKKSTPGQEGNKNPPPKREGPPAEKKK